MITETIYYDAMLFGNINATYNDAIYKDTRTTNILSKQENWRASIVSMSIPTTFIPIRVVEIEKDPILNTTNVNMTVYRCSFTFGPTTVSNPLIWIPQVLTNWNSTDGVPTVVETSTAIDVKHYAYYSLRNIHHFTFMLNNLLTTTFNSLKALQPSITAEGPPFFIYNGSTGLYSIHLPTKYLNDNIQVTFNYKLNRFFEMSFPCFYGNGGARFLFDEFVTPINTVTYNGIDYYVLHQTHSTISKFYTEGGFRTLEVISESLQMRNELVQNQNTSDGIFKTTGSAFDSIMTDYRVGIEQGDELKTTLIYNPTAQYRYITLTGSGPLRNIDFFIRYKDNFGNAYPLLIPFGECAMVKILFERIKAD